MAWKGKERRGFGDWRFSWDTELVLVTNVPEQNTGNLRHGQLKGRGSDIVVGRHPACRGTSDRHLSGGVFSIVNGSSCSAQA